MIYARTFEDNTSIPKAIAVIAVGVLLAGVLAYVSPDMPDTLPAFLGDAFAHIQDSITVTAIGSISDDANTRVLDGPRATDIIDLRGQLFAFVVAGEEDGIQILNITTPSNIIAVANMTDDNNVVLDDPRDIELFIHGGMLYAAVASYGDDGVQILDVTGHFAGRTPIVAVSNVTDTSSLELSGASAIDVFDYDDKRYAAVAAYGEGGVQILNLTEPTTHPIPTVSRLSPGADTMLYKLEDIKTFERGGKPYAITTSGEHDAIQVINLTDPTNIVAVNSIVDTPDLLLGDPIGLDIFKEANTGNIYAVVASQLEHGIQLFEVGNLPDIIPVASISDSDDNDSTTGRLTSPTSVKTFAFSGDTYAAVGTISSGIKIVNITDPGNPVNAGGLDSTISDPFDFIRDIDALPGGDRLVLTSYGDDKIRMVQLAGKTLSNDPPTIAILNQTVNGGDTVTLEPVGVIDPNGDPMTYRWGYDELRMAEMLGVIIDDHLSRSTTFVAPHVRDDTDIVFKFEAVDHHGGKFVVDDNGAFVLKPGIHNGGYAFAKVWITVQGTQPPIVDAGMNQTVHAGTLVTLNGSVNDPEGNDPVTHLWVAESNATLADPNALTTTFTAPIVAVETILQFILFGTDSLGAVASDSVYVTVLPNQPPVIDPIPNMAVDEGTQFTLTASATDPEGDTPLTYQWIIVAVPSSPELTIDNATIRSPTFTAPLVTTDTEYRIFVYVTDSRGATAHIEVDLTVLDVPSPRPIVTAGDNQAVDEGDTVTLTGTATDPDGEAMTYKWVCRDDTTTLEPGTTLSVTFTAPDVNQDSTFTCTLTATDPHGSTGTAQLALHVRNVPDDRPILTLNGEYTPTIVVGSSWTDPGATCVTLRDGTPLHVRVSGSVDTHTAGTYTLTYKCGIHGVGSTSQDRIITVIAAADDTAPSVGILNIRGAIASGLTNPDFGGDARCTDTEDGDISHTITVSVRYGSPDEDGKVRADITYSCVDSGGNTGSASVNVAVISTTNNPPEIDKNGGITWVTVGEQFTDPGATCTDVEDGTWDATVVSNTVDTSTAGTYAVIYECRDSGGLTNIGGSVRTVYVVAPEENTPPTITVDNSDIHVSLGGTWTVPDATCHDDEDGDLTDNIKLRHVESVDVNKEGTYYFVISCKDYGREGDGEDVKGVQVIIDVIVS